jgi:hypothetical protein
MSQQVRRASGLPGGVRTLRAAIHRNPIPIPSAAEWQGVSKEPFGSPSHPLSRTAQISVVEGFCAGGPQIPGIRPFFSQKSRSVGKTPAENMDSSSSRQGCAVLRASLPDG